MSEQDRGKAQGELSYFERYVLEKIEEIDRSVRQDSLSTIGSPKVMEHLKRSKREFLEAIVKVARMELERLGREIPKDQG
jgi:hypothetical protein